MSVCRVRGALNKNAKLAVCHCVVLRVCATGAVCRNLSWTKRRKKAVMILCTVQRNRNLTRSNACTILIFNTKEQKSHVE